jgi:hypothetical protein
MRMPNRIIIAGFLALTALAMALLISSSGTSVPSLNISFLRYEHQADADYAIVEIKNVGSGTACYYGYGADHPFYEVMVDDGTGWTKGPNLFWCGTGAGPALLPPGKTRMVRVSLHTNQTWKVGVSFSQVTLEDRLPKFIAHRLPKAWQSQPQTYTAWSPPVPYVNTP